MAPSWALSAAIHAAILVPLCLITWVVAVQTTGEPLITLADVPAALPPIGPPVDLHAGAGEEDEGLGVGKPGGAAGSGDDDWAVGDRSKNFALPPKGGLTGGEWSAAAGMGGGLPGFEGQDVGNPYGSGSDPAKSLIRNILGRGSGAYGGGGLGRKGDLIYGTGRSFGAYIGDLRGRGLDVVLVLDATDSMNPYIKQAKVRLSEVLNVLEALVPGARVGIVAYKDYGDDYGPSACKALPITTDANAVRRFLEGVVAGGGGDEPEPIHEALKIASDAKAMGWNMQRKKVIILVGDSSVHPSGRQEAFRLAKSFADQKGTVNVIDVGGSGDQGARRAQVQPDMIRIAKDGGGDAFLLKEEKEFWQHLTVSIFGERFKEDVDVIIQRYARKE